MCICGIRKRRYGTVATQIFCCSLGAFNNALMFVISVSPAILLPLYADFNYLFLFCLSITMLHNNDYFVINKKRVYVLNFLWVPEFRVTLYRPSIRCFWVFLEEKTRNLKVNQKFFLLMPCPKYY